MTKTIEIRHRSVLPMYGTAIWVLLGALFLPVYRLWGLALLLVLAAVLYAVLAKICPGRVEKKEVTITTGSEEKDALLDSISADRKSLHELNERISDDALSAAILRMEKACDGILNWLNTEEGELRALRRFSKFYLPDAIKILDLYADLDEQGVQGENADGIRREVEENAQVIADAFEKQLDALYTARSLDAETDLDVLKGMLKGQGLL